MQIVVRSARDTSKRGGALILALTAIVLVALTSSVLLQISLSTLRRQSSATENWHAFNLAEAGLAESYIGIAIGKTGNVGTSTQPALFGHGMFWVETTANTDGTISLESTALYGSGRVSLGMVIEAVEFNAGSMGFFSADDLKISPDALIDSYDSSSGSYAEQVGTSTNEQAVLGSNGDIKLANSVVVRGDVNPGTDARANVGTATITGAIANRASEATLPAIEVPVMSQNLDLKHDGAVPVIIPPGEAGYDKIKVGKGSKLIIQGPATLVVKDLGVSNNGEIYFDTTDGPVELHVTGNVDLKKQSKLNVSGTSPADVMILVSSPSSASINFECSSSFHGFIYAPQAKVKASADFEIFGGLVAKEIDLSGKGKWHFDLDLLASMEDSLPVMLTWRVLEIPSAIRAKRNDPFTMLDLDKNDLSSPAEAHQDQMLVIQYVDGSGVPSSYTGMESGFDWADVSSVESGTRDGAGFEAVPERNPAGGGVNTGDGGDVVVDEDEEDEEDEKWLAILAHASLDSSKLKDVYIMYAPVPDRFLNWACQGKLYMNSSDLESVLLEHGPDKGQPQLSTSVLQTAIGSGTLDSNHLKSVLIDNSPLSNGVLTHLTSLKSNPLNSSDLLSVLAAQ